VKNQAPIGEDRLNLYRQRQELERQQQKMLEDIARDVGVSVQVLRATAAGDARRLRGIPCQSQGVGGTMPGTDPLQVLLDKEEEAA
jgi:hypothetical protein